ncbi:hypothetical protein Lal_00046672 [Lupinus albus]|nr:hypothetical protein Lal_00045013 [Lupinus albus]KAF1855317.1 hypothetical protein Lal_00048013 [Lupinus albus]KAF1855645.1 hypothetical protein Lal_00046535 [Lupinus albus]KAF1856287.1 hypothetical protein Lal_00046672 [Lupinus albus]
MCALLRCRPGLTVPRWVVVGIPRTCRGFSCDPFCTEGCGARCCSNGHGRSTKGQVSKHPEVHFWRLNMVEAMARLWLRPSATCPLLPVPRKSTKGQVPKHPEVHPGRFNTVGAMGRSWSNQSTMFLLSPCPSGKCSVEVPAWPHSAELPQHHGSSSQSSGSAPWAVQHGWSHGADVVESISNVSPVALSLGKVFCRGAGLASQCRVGLLRGSLGIVVASTEARCSRKVVVLGEPFLGVSAAPCMGQVPKHPEVHPGLFNTVGAMGRSWSNQSAMFLLSPCPSGKCSVEVPAWPHSAELVCCGDPSELSCLLLWHVLHGRLWCSVNPSWAYMQSTKGRKSHNLVVCCGWFPWRKRGS